VTTALGSATGSVGFSTAFGGAGWATAADGFDVFEGVAADVWAAKLPVSPIMSAIEANCGKEKCTVSS
jgi:hypothetical protein